MRTLLSLLALVVSFTALAAAPVAPFVGQWEVARRDHFLTVSNLANSISSTGGITLTTATNVVTGTMIQSNASFVRGPGSATDNAIARFDATTGKLIQNSGVTVSDGNNVAGVQTLDVNEINITGAIAQDTGTGTADLGPTTITDLSVATQTLLAGTVRAGTNLFVSGTNGANWLFVTQNLFTTYLDVSTYVLLGVGANLYLRDDGTYIALGLSDDVIYRRHGVGTAGLAGASGVTGTGSLLASNVVVRGAIIANHVVTNLVNGFTNGSGHISLLGPTNNGDARVKGLSASGAITLTDNGTNIVIGASAASGEANVNGEVSLTNATLFGLVNGKAGVTNLLRSIAARNGLVGTNEGGTNISIAIDPAIVASQANLTDASNALRVALVTNTVWIDAGAMRTNGGSTADGGRTTAATGTFSDGTSSFDVYDFDDATNEHANFSFAMGPSFSGIVQVHLHWLSTNALNPGLTNIVWEIAAQPLATNNALSGYTWQTNLTTRFWSSNALQIASLPVLTITNYNPRNLIKWRIGRLGTNTSDAAVGDVRLLGAELSIVSTNYTGGF